MGPGTRKELIDVWNINDRLKWIHKESRTATRQEEEEQPQCSGFFTELSMFFFYFIYYFILSLKLRVLLFLSNHYKFIVLKSENNTELFIIHNLNFLVTWEFYPSSHCLKISGLI